MKLNNITECENESYRVLHANIILRKFKNEQKQAISYLNTYMDIGIMCQNGNQLWTLRILFSSADFYFWQQDFLSEEVSGTKRLNQKQFQIKGNDPPGPPGSLPPWFMSLQTLFRHSQPLRTLFPVPFVLHISPTLTYDAFLLHGGSQSIPFSFPPQTVTAFPWLAWAGIC